MGGGGGGGGERETLGRSGNAKTMDDCGSYSSAAPSTAGSLSVVHTRESAAAGRGRSSWLDIGRPSHRRCCGSSPNRRATHSADRRRPSSSIRMRHSRRAHCSARLEGDGGCHCTLWSSAASWWGAADGRGGSMSACHVRALRGRGRGRPGGLASVRAFPVGSVVGRVADAADAALVPAVAVPRTAPEDEHVCIAIIG